MHSGLHRMRERVALPPQHLCQSRRDCQQVSTATICRSQNSIACCGGEGRLWGGKLMPLKMVVKRRSTCPQPIHNRLEGISVEGQLVEVGVKLWLRTYPCTKLRDVEVFKLVQHRIGRGARSNDDKPVGQAGERLR